MSNDFITYVEAWDALCGKIAEKKKELKEMTDSEMTMRKAIEASIETALGDAFKEGVNNYPLGDGRTLKVTRKIDRKIDPASLDLARDEYRKLNEAPVAFDDLLRIKYELEKKNFDKLSGASYLAFSRAITEKNAAPTVELS